MVWSRAKGDRGLYQTADGPGSAGPCEKGKFPKRGVFCACFFTGDDKSALAISVYPNDEAREAGKKRAASRVSENFELLFKDTLRLSGKVMTKHIQQK